MTKKITKNKINPQIKKISFNQFALGWYGFFLFCRSARRACIQGEQIGRFKKENKQ